MTVIKAISYAYSKLQRVVDKYMVYVLRWIIIRATFIYCLQAQKQNNKMRGKEKKLCFGFVKCFMEGRHLTSLQLPTFFLVCVVSLPIFYWLYSWLYLGYICQARTRICYLCMVVLKLKVEFYGHVRMLYTECKRRRRFKHFYMYILFDGIQELCIYLFFAQFLYFLSSSLSFFARSTQITMLSRSSRRVVFVYNNIIRCSKD